MPALNFTVSIDKLLKGKKWHTIRKTLPKGWIKGNKLTLYKGMRTKYCIHLATTKCGHFNVIKIDSSTESVAVRGLSARFTSKEDLPIVGHYNWLELGILEIEKLAKNDGFKTSKDFFDYFKNYNEPAYLLHFDKKLQVMRNAIELHKKGLI